MRYLTDFRRLNMADLIASLMGALRKQNPAITAPDADKLQRQLENEIAKQQPPTIAFIGLTGVGKTSTVNTLFNHDLPVSHTRPCTTLPTPVSGELYEFTGAKGDLIVYDMPGLGEDEDTDEKYYAMYRDILPRVDVAVWVINVPNRQVAPIQQAIRRLRAELGDAQVNKIVVAASMADRIEPYNWVPGANIPSKEQDEHLEDYLSSISERIAKVLTLRSGGIVAYSNTKRYQLERLMRQIVESAPPERAWLFGEVADVADVRELIDPRFLQYIEQASLPPRR